MTKFLYLNENDNSNNNNNHKNKKNNQNNKNNSKLSIESTMILLTLHSYQFKEVLMLMERCSKKSWEQSNNNNNNIFNNKLVSSSAEQLEFVRHTNTILITNLLRRFVYAVNKSVSREERVRIKIASVIDEYAAEFPGIYLTPIESLCRHSIKEYIKTDLSRFELTAEVKPLPLGTNKPHRKGEIIKPTKTMETDNETNTKPATVSSSMSRSSTPSSSPLPSALPSVQQAALSDRGGPDSSNNTSITSNSTPTITVNRHTIAGYFWSWIWPKQQQNAQNTRQEGQQQ